MSTTQQPTNVIDSIITEHSTSFGRMHQHFGNKRVKITTDFYLNAIGYYVDGTLKRFVQPATEKALADLQQEAFEAWLSLHN